MKLSSPSSSENMTFEVIHAECSGCRGDSERRVCTGATPASFKGQQPTPVSVPSAGGACPPPHGPGLMHCHQPGLLSFYSLCPKTQNPPGAERPSVPPLSRSRASAPTASEGSVGNRQSPNAGVNLTDLSFSLHICNYPDRVLPLENLRREASDEGPAGRLLAKGGDRSESGAAVGLGVLI